MKSIIVAVVLGCLAFTLSYQPTTQAESFSQGEMVEVPSFDQSVAQQLASQDLQICNLQDSLERLQSQVAAIKPCTCDDSPLPQSTAQPVLFTQDQPYCDPTTGVCYDAQGNPLSSDNCPDGTCGTMSSSAGGIFTRSDGDARRPAGRLLSAVGDRLVQRPGIIGRIRARRGY